jgi:hypothetical protein
MTVVAPMSMFLRALAVTMRYFLAQVPLGLKRSAVAL